MTTKESRLLIFNYYRKKYTDFIIMSIGAVSAISNLVIFLGWFVYTAVSCGAEPSAWALIPLFLAFLSMPIAAMFSSGVYHRERERKQELRDKRDKYGSYVRAIREELGITELMKEYKC